MKDIHVVMPMYNLIEDNANYLKTSGSLWKYYKDEPAINKASGIIHFPDNSNNSSSVKYKQKISRKTTNNGTNYVEISVPLKYIGTFLKTLEMPLIYCKIGHLMLLTVKYQH